MTCMYVILYTFKYKQTLLSTFLRLKKFKEYSVFTNKSYQSNLIKWLSLLKFFKSTVRLKWL